MTDTSLMLLSGAVLIVGLLTIGLIALLNAQRQLYSTRRDLARARYDTIMNGLRLKAAAGSLREDDLVPVNNLLQK